MPDRTITDEQVRDVLHDCAEREEHLRTRLARMSQVVSVLAALSASVASLPDDDSFPISVKFIRGAAEQYRIEKREVERDRRLGRVQ